MVHRVLEKQVRFLLLLMNFSGKGDRCSEIACVVCSPQLFRDRVMELNSSDERGINVIREKVKKFAQFSVIATRTE